MPWEGSENLPESVQEWDEVKNSDNADKFWEQMTNHRVHLGQSIRIPSDEAGDEDWKTFNEKMVEKVPSLIKRPKSDDAEGMSLLYKAMGRPDSADKYTIPDLTSEGGIKLDTSPIEAFRPIAHEFGLTQGQFDGIISKMTGINVTATMEGQKTHNEAMQSLRVDWGLKFDSNMEKAKNVAKATNAPKALSDSIELGTASSDTLIWLTEMADRIGPESDNINKDKSITPGVLTPAEAKGRLNEILSNKTNPYWVKDHPDNKEMIKKVFQLQTMANPGASTNINDLRAGAGAGAVSQ